MMVLFYLVLIHIQITKSINMVYRNSMDLPLERQIQDLNYGQKAKSGLIMPSNEQNWIIPTCLEVVFGFI